MTTYSASPINNAYPAAGSVMGRKTAPMAQTKTTMCAVRMGSVVSDVIIFFSTSGPPKHLMLIYPSSSLFGKLDSLSLLCFYLFTLESSSSLI